MQNLPHHYSASAVGAVDGDVELTTHGVTGLRSASPVEFGGPGDRWSPETLLIGAVADCFILTFRPVARASKLPWTWLQCQVTGTLDRIDRSMQFTHLKIHARLVVPAGGDPDQARRALEKAERGCLISNSLTATIELKTDIEVAAGPVSALTGA